MSYPGTIARLIESFLKLPGIGPKTAARLAFFVLKMPREEVATMARALVEARDKTVYCKLCGNYSEEELCIICRDRRRSCATICVVQEARDVLAMEKTREFKGLYHVLGGSISPLDGIGPDQLRIRELLDRLAVSKVQELILATNPNVEGEATALYLAKVIKPLGVRVTRIAHGLPVGADLEYADEVTLARALEGRREL